MSRFSLAFVALVSTMTGSVRADEKPTSEPNASMSCDRSSEPGRVRCVVEAHAGAGRAIAWADVAIVSLPENASALKGRLGQSDATVREPKTHKWALGLVAKKTGQGELRAKVRLVLCDENIEVRASHCAATTLDVKAAVFVGG